MYDENPYAAPESVSGFAPSVVMSGYAMDRFYVDGKHIMCGSAVELPEICVLTGARDDLVKMTKTISWLPRLYFFLLMFGMIGVIIFVVLRLTQQKKCQVSYYLSRSSRNFRLFLTVVGWLGIASIAFMIIAGSREMVPAEILLVAFLVAIVGFLVMVIVGQLPIRIDRHEGGVKFWLKGFKQPFFDQLRVMYAKSG